MYAIIVILILMALGFMAVLFISIFSGDIESAGGNVALIPIEGVITGSDDSGFLFDDTVNSPDTIKLIEKAAKNPNIKAVILMINSPGGSPVASEEIANAILKLNKTTVAWIRESGTSGAYWIASASDHIVASRMSITGSIGVIASYLEFPGFLGRYNITYRRLVAGDYKDIGSPYKEMTPEEEMALQNLLDEMRDYFVNEVAKNRRMSKRDIDKAANGLFYLGSEAKELGLVDELGGKEEAIAYIEQKESITAVISEYKTDKGLFEILAGAMNENSFNIGKGIGASLIGKSSSNTLSIS
jgi:protease IV